MEKEPCPNVLLVRNEVGQVSISPACGQIQLTLQYISLRFGGDAFNALARLVVQAQSRLDAAQKIWEASDQSPPGEGFH